MHLLMFTIPFIFSLLLTFFVIVDDWSLNILL